MKSRTVRVLTSLLLIAGLAACGSSDDDPATDGSGETLATLKVGATPVPHAEILNYVKDNLAEAAGLDLQIVEFTDYIQPNIALNEGQLDANYFQHLPYLEEQMAAAGYDFVNIGGVHLEPLGLYSQKITALDQLADGAIIAIPNDPTNGGRALKLLESNQLLTLEDTGDTSPTVHDIAENPRNLDVVEIEAAQLPRSLQDVDAAVINGNYAIEADLNPAEDALVIESAEDNPYVNVLVARAEDKDDPNLQTLIALLQGPEVRAFIEETYSGAVIPAT